MTAPHFSADVWARGPDDCQSVGTLANGAKITEFLLSPGSIQAD